MATLGGSFPIGILWSHLEKKEENSCDQVLPPASCFLIGLFFTVAQLCRPAVRFGGAFLTYGSETRVAWACISKRRVYDQYRVKRFVETALNVFGRGKRLTRDVASVHDFRWSRRTLSCISILATYTGILYGLPVTEKEYRWSVFVVCISILTITYLH